MRRFSKLVAVGGVCALALVASALPSHAGVGQVDMAITKTDGVTTVTAGTTVTYTIVVSNNSSTASAIATVTDNFPATLTAVSWTCSGGGSCESSSGTGDLAETDFFPAGDSLTYTVTATLDCAATGILTNTATVTATGEINPQDNSATDTDTITAATCPPPASESNLVVDKVVEGAQPEGTQFTVQLACGIEGQLPDINQVVINGPGNVADALFNTTDDTVTCTVTEPEDGGATSVISCDDDGVASCETGNRITFPETESSEGTITVTNTFEEPRPPPTPEPAAAAIEAAPAFTG